MVETNSDCEKAVVSSDGQEEAHERLKKLSMFTLNKRTMVLITLGGREGSSC